ncbi:hypothetical protein GCM10020000_73900 [Streptomyces olivoverticillatus]
MWQSSGVPGGGVRAVEEGFPEADGEDDGAVGVGGHQPVAEELPGVVEQRAGGRAGW